MMDMEYINLSEMSDMEIAVRMRQCNYPKYKTLVRMHLSFELDLNTDEFDLPCHEILYEDKGKMKKWNRMSKKHKHLSSGATSCGGSTKASSSAGNSPSDNLYQQLDPGFLFHLKELKDFLLLEKNITQEGIFRKTGSASRQNELRMQIQNDRPLDFNGGGYSAHDCATVFKGYLADIPEPLLTDAHYPAHLQIAPLCIRSKINSLSSAATMMKPPNPERLKREQHLLNSVQLLLLLLPDENRELLQHIIEILHAVANRENANKMSADNLATLFTPHLICARNMPPEALHYVAKKMSSIIAYMVNKGLEIFNMPAKLATDIRAYFLERKRKKTMSPEQMLDDSISDISTVNTVYTFVDREKTAAAHTANNTDTELAQLYAHIQSMPESSKKRRLIKQFNKQNGQGTPLQFVVLNRLKNSEATRSAKSIGDSIKKHIFHKGIMSRTPKRQNAPVSVMDIETPNNTINKAPKLRVLFQSPTAGHGATSTDIKPTATTSTTITTMSSSSSLNTPYAIKLHPLHKSISSSSLLLDCSSSRNTDTRPIDDLEPFASSSSDGFAQTHSSTTKFNSSASAPVSRQTSTDLHENSPPSSSSNSAATSLLSHSSTSSVCSNTPTTSNQFPLADQICCSTALKMIADTARSLIGAGGGGGEKKTVAWNDSHILDTEVMSQHNTPVGTAELKSRYKSEPNLRHMVEEKSNQASNYTLEYTPTAKGSKSLAVSRKLIKGVSMSNLKYSFNTAETTRRLASLNYRSSDELQTVVHATAEPLLEDTNDSEDLDDDTFEDNTDDDHIDNDNTENSREHEALLDAVTPTTNDGGSNSSDMPDGTGSIYQQLLLQQSNPQRHLEVFANTPSMLLGRRSMSPITKSTQRMPKAMQESIMTPRSRKPVMVLTNALGSSDPNQTTYQTDLSSFREQDEEDSHNESSKRSTPNLDNENAVSADSYSNLFSRRKRFQAKLNYEQHVNAAMHINKEDSSSNEHNSSKKSGSIALPNNALTNHFKEYLLSRSVLTASPADSSFSSQPDDFESTRDMEDLDESQLSPSLLYCLDGNEPDIVEAQSTANINSECLTQGKLETNFNGADIGTPPTAFANKMNAQSFAKLYMNNARKRAAASNFDKLSTSPLTHLTSASKTKAISSNKENCERTDGYLMTKKLLITEFPGETSL